jgi:hypothetical protein
MTWFDIIGLAEIHRTTYIAILKSWIPHGKKGDYARRVGIEFDYSECRQKLPNENTCAII